MNSISDDSRAADDVFANSSAETVLENISFSFFVERDNVLIGSNSTRNSDENKFCHVITVKNADLYEADPGKCDRSSTKQKLPNRKSDHS